MTSLVTVQSQEVAMVGLKNLRRDWRGLQTLSHGPVIRPLPIDFKQCSLTHTVRVLPPLISIVCQISMAFPICYFPPCLSTQGRLDDPRMFLLIPPGSTRDTVMRDMAHQSLTGSTGHLAFLRESSILNLLPLGFNPSRAPQAI